MHDRGPAGLRLTNGIPKLSPVRQQGLCKPYVGLACSKYVGQDYIFVSEGLLQVYIEQKLSAAFSIILSSPDLSGLSTIPLCDHFTEWPHGLCREECKLLENWVCCKELAIA